MTDKQAIPYIKKLNVLEGLRLAVTWKSGATEIVDMSGTIAGIVSMDALEDPALFATARVAAYGRAVEWDGGIDYSADSIHELAIEQNRQFTGPMFKAWQEAIGLSNSETAELLDVDLSTVKNYRAKVKSLPRVVRFACDGLAANRQMVRANIHPRRAGRPKGMPTARAKKHA